MIPRLPPELLGSGHRAVLATLVGGAGGSTVEGATMWVDESGGIIGGVTIGGCVEGRIVAEAERMADSADCHLVKFALGDDDAIELGLGCAGAIEVLLEPVALRDPADPVIAALTAMELVAAEGRSIVQVAALSGVPRRLIVSEDGGIGGSLGSEDRDRAATEEAMRALADGRQRHVSLGDLNAWVAPHAPPRTLIVFGASPVAPPLVRFGSALGWRVIVVDARERFLTHARFPDADELRVGMPSEIAENIARSPRCAVVIVAHDYKVEVPVLRAVLAGDAGYVGLVGSRKRGAAVLGFLREAGVSEEALRRVRVPVGLDIGARTSEEIALSIVAEIMAAGAGRNAGSLALSARAGDV